MCSLKKNKCIEWKPSDYNSVSDFPANTNYLDKCYFYNSCLALDGDIYKIPNSPSDYPPAYGLYNFNVNFNTPNCGVPGPFPYSFPWSQWGGDETYGTGQDFYTGLIEDSLHKIVMYLMNKIYITKLNKKACTVSQDLMLQQLRNGNVQIFKWFSQLVDINGNAIPFDPTIPAGALKSLENLLITGEGTYDGIINPMQIVNSLQNFINIFAPGNVELQANVNNLNAFLNNILELNVPNVKPIDFLCYQKIAKYNQSYPLKSFKYIDCVYTNKLNKHDKTYKKANKQISKTIDLGRQVAAFFGTFYSAVAFLDIFLNVFGDTSPVAIPTAVRTQRVQWIFDSMTRYAYEYFTFIIDYCKATSKQDDISSYKIQVSAIEVCASLSVSIGEIFRAFDAIIRNRDIYNKLPPAFP